MNLGKPPVRIALRGTVEMAEHFKILQVDDRQAGTEIHVKDPLIASLQRQPQALFTGAQGIGRGLAQLVFRFEVCHQRVHRIIGLL